MPLPPPDARRRVSPGALLLLPSLLLPGPALLAAPWIVITEVHYHPPEGDALEFIEIHSREPPRADLSGWRLEGEIRYRFAEGTIILPGEHLIVAASPADLKDVHGQVGRVLGPFSGKLDNKGGRVTLRNGAGARVFEVDYRCDGEWPLSPDGTGHTLSLRDTLFDPSRPGNWAASREIGGTPGRENSVADGLEDREGLEDSDGDGVLVNEVFAPSKDTDSAFVELYNSTPRDIDLGGLFLSDDRDHLRAFRIPRGTVLRRRGHHAFTQRELGGALELSGNELFLTLTTSNGRRVVDALRVKGGAEAAKSGARKGDATKTKGATQKSAPEPGVPEGLTRSHGRHPDGSVDVALLRRPTPGAPNEADVLRDVVINEIHYHPLDNDSDDEYVELHNRGKKVIDLEGFRLRGGARYRFEKGEKIEPGGYLVLARSSRAMSKYGLGAGKVVGPLRGVLNNRGETLTLLDASGNVADRVAYSDRSPWPQWADGLGSSLELVHPGLDNSLPAAWKASDERSKARWKTFSYVKPHRVFGNRNLSELQFLLLGEGECLVDNVHLRREKELVEDGSFKHGDAGWKGMGTHELSGAYRDGSTTCYRIVADGRGDIRRNYVTFNIAGGALVPDKSYKISLRVKWQRGVPLLLTRTAGQGVARMHRLDVPSRIGTPGKRNSAYVAEAAPVVGAPRQHPVAPSAGDPVRVDVRISSLIPLSSFAIQHRPDGGDWQRSPLKKVSRGDSGDSALYRGEIPPHGGGIVEFYVEAEASAGRKGRYPLDAPARTLLYAVGLTPDGKYPTYTLLVTSREWKALMSRPRLSNRLSDATLVYNTSRIFHNVGFRRRGSPWTRSKHNWRIVFGADTLDGRTKLTIDGQGGDGTRLNERLTYWLAESLRAPNVKQQYVSFRLHGHEQGVYEDIEKIGGDFLDNWFESPADPERSGDAGRKSKKKKKKSTKRKKGTAPRGHLHKVDDYFELFPDGGRDYVQAYLDFKSKDPESYRWNFPQRANGSDEQWEPLVKLIHLMDPDTTPTRVFARKAGELLDVDVWLKVLATRILVDDWDTFGHSRGKNAFLYQGARDGRWRLVPWDCDLAWRNASSPLFTNTFASVRRLLEIPEYRRRFLGYIGYLAKGKFEAKTFGEVLTDISSRTGAGTGHFSGFASARRNKVLGELPKAPVQVTSGKRVSRRGEPDRWVASGTAPPLVMRFRLDGREGEVELTGADAWKASFPIGPEGGEATLAALDFGGGDVESVTVKVTRRRGARSLDVKPPEVVRKRRRRTKKPERPARADRSSPSVTGTTKPAKETTAKATTAKATSAKTTSADDVAAKVAAAIAAHTKGRAPRREDPPTTSSTSRRKRAGEPARATSSSAAARRRGEPPTRVERRARPEARRVPEPPVVDEPKPAPESSSGAGDGASGGGWSVVAVGLVGLGVAVMATLIVLLRRSSEEDRRQRVRRRRSGRGGPGPGRGGPRGGRRPPRRR